jgi:hypothetical protein
LTTIYDNIVESLGEQLIKTFQASERIDAAVGYFNLRGWRDLSEELDTRDPNADGSPVARVIVGMTGPSSHEAVLEDLQREVAGENKDISLDGPEAKKRRKEAMERFKEQLMRGLPDAARKKALLRMRRHLNDGVLRVRLFTRRPMHGKTYICHREDVATPIIGYVGSSNLTLPGLKYQYELNVDVIDGDAATKLAKWFQDRWDDEFCLDITQELIDLLDESWAAEKPADPYLIYLKVCYLLSQEARDGLLQFDLPQDIHNQLLDFQAAAVKTLAHRVYHRGGAMLGDVVGLGKTISAIAVAAILREEYGFRPLVVCPKNLVLMWEEYLRTYDLHGQVIPFSMAKKNLPKTRRYQFVIVDESHTLRNHDTQAYEAVAEYLEENSSKVLLLTARTSASPPPRPFRSTRASWTGWTARSQPWRRSLCPRRLRIGGGSCRSTSSVGPAPSSGRTMPRWTPTTVGSSLRSPTALASTSLNERRVLCRIHSAITTRPV